MHPRVLALRVQLSPLIVQCLYRMGSRSNWGIVARSEAEFNEIVDNLNEQEVRVVGQEHFKCDFLAVHNVHLLFFMRLLCFF